MVSSNEHNLPYNSKTKHYKYIEVHLLQQIQSNNTINSSFFLIFNCFLIKIFVELFPTETFFGILFAVGRC